MDDWVIDIVSPLLMLYMCKILQSPYHTQWKTKSFVYQAGLLDVWMRASVFLHQPLIERNKWIHEFKRSWETKGHDSEVTDPPDSWLAFSYFAFVLWLHSSLIISFPRYAQALRVLWTSPYRQYDQSSWNHCVMMWYNKSTKYLYCLL